MKRTLLIIVACLVSHGVNSQNGKKFNYEKNRFGMYAVTPIFDQSKGVGKKGVAYFSDPYYLKTLFDGIGKKILTKEKIDSLYSEVSVTITLSSEGEVLNCRFLMNGKDMDVISDDDFYNLYLLFKQTKIDMSKVMIGSPDSSTQNSEFDYGIISGTLIPKEFRSVFKKLN